MKPKKTKPGLKEIAAGAGVSIATVSRVVNGTSRVGPGVEERVRAAATALGVNLSQRNRTKALVFLLSNRAMLHAFHSRILVGAEACCAAHGWDMIFLSFQYSPHVHWKDLHLPNVVGRRDVARAVILAGTNSPNLLELLRNKSVTFVVLGNNVIGDFPELNYDAVYSDDIQGGRDMTRHLIDLGHRDIWFVGNLRLPWFSRCHEGYQSAMTEAGLQVKCSSIDSESDSEIGYLGTKSLLARGEAVTAILAGNDLAAEGVYKALRDCRLRIPDDISVAGCDDTCGSMLHPGLTTIREFPEQLGKHMVDLVLRKIDNPGLDPQRITVPTQFIGRESCRSILPSRETGRPMALEAGLAQGAKD